MTAKRWRSKIRKYCEEAGTYRPFFESVINTLADILEKRDLAQAQFEQSGGSLIIEYTNKGGATNPSKNPFVVMWDELNKTALAYWRDLGLTPAGLKKINDSAMKAKKKASFADLLKDELDE